MSSELLAFSVRALVTLLAVVDPLGNVPFFLPATEGMDKRQRAGVAVRASVVAAAVLLAFAAGGTAVLWAFRLTMPAVKIGGGVVLLVIAMRMLSGRQFDWEQGRKDVEAGRGDPIVPLAIPLMAGPGAMSSVMALTAEEPGLTHMLVVMAAVVVVCGLGCLCYISAAALMRRLGRTAMVTLSCLMGLILAALAVQFMLEGLTEALPGLFVVPPPPRQ
jgi:multiple antibiotic resistance protein